MAWMAETRAEHMGMYELDLLGGSSQLGYVVDNHGPW